MVRSGRTRSEFTSTGFAPKRKVDEPCMWPKPVTAHSITSSARATSDCAPEPLLVPRGEAVV
jgi:hypothetical protein